MAAVQSKTANIYMALEIDRRYRSQGLHENSVPLVHAPYQWQKSALCQINAIRQLRRRIWIDLRCVQGFHMSSLTPHMPQAMRDVWIQSNAAKARNKSLEQAAATVAWAAIGKEWEGKGGEYLEDCKQGELGQGGRLCMVMQHMHTIQQLLQSFGRNFFR